MGYCGCDIEAKFEYLKKIQSALKIEHTLNNLHTPAFSKISTPKIGIGETMVFKN